MTMFADGSVYDYKRRSTEAICHDRLLTCGQHRLSNPSLWHL